MNIAEKNRRAARFNRGISGENVTWMNDQTFTDYSNFVADKYAEIAQLKIETANSIKKAAESRDDLNQFYKALLIVGGVILSLPILYLITG
jgi:hypothetical protein